ncbi:hypothetical protein ACLMJK_005930 [Lecanora helva]
MILRYDCNRDFARSIGISYYDINLAIKLGVVSNNSWVLQDCTRIELSVPCSFPRKSYLMTAVPSTTPQVRVGVGVFVLEAPQRSLDNPRFLIGERLNAHGAGTWATPGGHLEFGESFEECAAREVMEETGLKVKNVRFLTATNNHMPADRKHYVTIFMACERENDHDQPRVMEPQKCALWDWSTWEDLLGWVRQGGEVKGKKLFTPLLNLIRQHPGLIPGRG